MNELNNKSGKVVTFYSFKGGVGRTMSLVNVACLLAKIEKKILLIDWDLEAPGLHSFFKDNINKEDLGLIEFILESVKFNETISEVQEKSAREFIEQNIDRFISKNVLGSNEFNLDIIKAGQFDSDYSNKLSSVDWIEFYKKSPFFFREFAETLESKYDYVFIDSRTGLSDTGGICTMLMPQILVLVFALNDQNIKGVVDIARQSIEYRFDSNDLRNLNVLPLPSRIDDNQKADDLQLWINRYSLEFEDLFKETYLLDECSLGPYFEKAKIPYKSEHAYGEKIPILTESAKNDLFISYHYQQFANLLLENIPTWEILSPEQIEENLKNANEAFKEGLKYILKNEFEDAYLSIEKAKDIAPNQAQLFFQWADYLGINALNEAGKKMDFLYAKSFELYHHAIDIKPDYHEAYYNWGIDLGNLAETKEDKEAEGLYQQAFEKFQKTIEINPNKHEAFYNWGTDLVKLAKIKEGKEEEDLYKQAFEKFQKAIDIKPDKHEALYNWGTSLGNLADIKEGKEAKDFYRQAFDKYQKAIDIKPDYHKALFNWGTDLGNLAKTEEGKEAEDLYRQAFDKFRKSLVLKSDYYEALYNWGNYLGNLAKIKGGKEAEDLYRQAFDKYQKAIDTKPDLHSAFYNWGNYLGDLAKTKEDKEAEDLYHQAFEKYQKAIDIKPDYNEAFYNWGTNLGNLAKTKGGVEAEDLYRQAFDKYQKAIDIKPDLDSAFYNWGNSLGDLAKTKEGKEAEDLYHQAFEKYQKAIDIKLDFHEAFNNWGTCLGYLAKTKDSKEAEDLYEEAFDKFQKAIENGAGMYNLACILAIRGETKKALNYLEISLSKNEVKVDFIVKDEDWTDYFNDDEFIKLLKKYK